MCASDKSDYKFIVHSSNCRKKDGFVAKERMTLFLELRLKRPFAVEWRCEELESGKRFKNLTIKTVTYSPKTKLSKYNRRRYVITELHSGVIVLSLSTNVVAAVTELLQNSRCLRRISCSGQCATVKYNA